MDILHAVLTVDINSLEQHDFESAKITLINGNKKRTIKASKLEDVRYESIGSECLIRNIKSRHSEAGGRGYLRL